MEGLAKLKDLKGLQKDLKGKRKIAGRITAGLASQVR